MSNRRILVIGGGAAGFFAAIAAAETCPSCDVTIIEATAHPLAKVKVSGGGRCNVTHACFEPRELVKRYPRGGRELLGAFHRFQPRDTIAWFAERGVELKTESDGRMFPITDNSQTIVDCLRRAAERSGVKMRTQVGMRDVSVSRSGEFEVLLTTGEILTCDRLMLSTGGNKASAAWAVATKLGHTIETLAPSLFTFNIVDPRLTDLAGLSVADGVASVVGTSLKERGPILVTHWGLSGPGILRLSAWGARELQSRQYNFTLLLNWAGGRSLEQVRAELVQLRNAQPRRQVANTTAFGIPSRLWEKLVSAAGIDLQAVWTSISNQAVNALGSQIAAAEFTVSGKSVNKEEFVTCGGIKLAEVDFKTLQSRVCPGLFFAGEVLDIDGITGGFNFQAAWTTGKLAGTAMADLSL